MPDIFLLCIKIKLLGYLMSSQLKDNVSPSTVLDLYLHVNSFMSHFHCSFWPVDVWQPGQNFLSSVKILLLISCLRYLSQKMSLKFSFLFWRSPASSPNPHCTLSYLHSSQRRLSGSFLDSWLFSWLVIVTFKHVISCELLILMRVCARTRAFVCVCGGGGAACYCCTYFRWK